MEQPSMPADPVPAWDGSATGQRRMPDALAPDRLRPWERALVRIPVFVVVSLLGGALGSFTLGANLLVLGAGGALVWLGMSGRVARRPASRPLGRRVAWWLAPVLLLALVELHSFARHSTTEYPTLSLLADPILEDYGVRAVCYFGWLVAFWGLVRR